VIGTGRCVRHLSPTCALDQGANGVGAVEGVVDDSKRICIPVATTYGMFNERSQGYSRQMNRHAVSSESGRYIYMFSISRTLLRMAVLFGLAGGLIIAVVANATEPFRGPLGIALSVLVLTLLIAHTFNNSSRRQRLEPAPPAARAGGHQVMVGKLRHNRSLASELSLLTELHAKGALSDEEFSLAKRHLLGG